MEQQAYTLKGFETTYQIGHTKAAELVKTGALKSYKVGRRRYVSKSAAEAWQRALEVKTYGAEVLL